MKTDYDIIIVGGGLVGSSLALALQKSDMRMLLIEKYPHNSQSQSNFDQKTIALTYGSKLIFQSLGIWQDIEKKQCQSIYDIHISNRGHFGQVHLSHRQTIYNALGYVASSNVIGNALWQSLKSQDNLDLLTSAEVFNCQQYHDHCEINVARQQQHPIALTSKLVVVADGGCSNLVGTDNRKIVRDDYQQTALLCIISTNKPHNGRAYERFTEEGPIALLPYCRDDRGKDQYAVVWTCENKNVLKRTQINNEEFSTSLQQAFGYRAGILSDPGIRKIYPLTRTIAKNPVQSRLLIIGNAAHTVHPVAGQGFNLGLQDVASLADIIVESRTLDRDIFIQFSKQRWKQTENVSRFTHSLIEIFGHPSKIVGLTRNIGLGIIELSPPMKRFLLKRTMGLAGKPSNLFLGSVPSSFL